MKKHILKFRPFSLMKLTAVCAALAAGAINQVSACTWFEFRNDLGNCFIGRTMEWPTDLHGRITLVPRGQVFGSFTMKYGFVGMSHGTGMAFSDGMNEHGLACSALWLSESQFSEKKEGAYHVGELLNYVLGCTKTVDEEIAFIKTNTFYTASEFGGFDLGIPMMIHFAITEPSGRSVVVEFIDGKATIHENKVGAMTNDPRFEEQLKNWSKYEGKKFGEETFEAFDFATAKLQSTSLFGTADYKEFKF
jgi:choloylglycine hydrolase